MSKIYKGLAFNDEAKFSLAFTTSVINDAINRHDLWPSASSVFSKVATVFLIMASDFKSNEGLTIKVNGNGPIGNVVVDGYKNHLRGYVDNPHVHFERNNTLDDELTLGNNGIIDVIKDLKLKNDHTSSIPLINGNLSYNFAYYYNISEQTPSALALGTKMDVDNTCLNSNGLLIQLLPNASEEALEKAEKAIEAMNNISNYFDYLEILKTCFNDDYKLTEVNDLVFKCSCSFEYFYNRLITLPNEDLDSMMNEGCEIVCHYCNSKYNYSIDDLKNIKELKEK